MKQTTLDPLRQLARDILSEQSDVASGVLGGMLKERLLDYVDIRVRADAPSWVAGDVDNLLTEACRRYMVNEIKQTSPGIVLVSPSGDTIRLPGVNAVLTTVVRDEEDGDIARFVQMQLLDMTRDQLLYVQTELERHATRVFKTARVVRHFLQLLQQYADAATPREACALANIDPYHIDEGKALRS